MGWRAAPCSPFSVLAPGGDEPWIGARRIELSDADIYFFTICCKACLYHRIYGPTECSLAGAARENGKGSCWESLLKRTGRRTSYTIWNKAYLSAWVKVTTRTTGFRLLVAEGLGWKYWRSSQKHQTNPPLPPIVTLHSYMFLMISTRLFQYKVMGKLYCTSAGIYIA